MEPHIIFKHIVIVFFILVSMFCAAIAIIDDTNDFSLSYLCFCIAIAIIIYDTHSIFQIDDTNLNKQQASDVERIKNVAYSGYAFFTVTVFLICYLSITDGVPRSRLHNNRLRWARVILAFICLILFGVLYIEYPNVT